MTRDIEYIKNTIILFIGKFATQFSSFLLIPLFTHYLTTDDYGFIDLVQTYIFLFVPVISLRLDSGVFRFLLDSREKEDEKKTIITNTLLIISITASVTSVLLVVISFFINIRFKLLILLNIIVLMFSGIVLQITRGIGKTKDYSIACCITGVATLLINSILILRFGIKGESILISSLIANILCILFIFIKDEILSLINIKLVEKNKIIELLKYSIPMIPNALSWWVVNVSDRTIITLFLSEAMNGVYSISCKFSNILNSIFSIFNMSWQETASLHIKDKDGDIFLSKMINNLWMIFISVSIEMILIIPVFFNIIIGKQYENAYIYIPILIIANIFSILISLIGGIYIGLKLTKQIANTTIISAIINIVINIALITHIGLLAAAFSTLIAYLLMAIYRFIDIQKYKKIKMEWKKIIFLFLLLVISTMIYYLKNSILNYIGILIIGIFLVLFNKNILVFYCKKVLVKNKGIKSSK